MAIARPLCTMESPGALVRAQGAQRDHRERQCVVGLSTVATMDYWAVQRADLRAILDALGGIGHHLTPQTRPAPPLTAPGLLVCPIRSTVVLATSRVRVNEARGQPFLVTSSGAGCPPGGAGRGGHPGGCAVARGRARYCPLARALAGGTPGLYTLFCARSAQHRAHASRIGRAQKIATARRMQILSANAC